MLEGGWTCVLSQVVPGCTLCGWIRRKERIDLVSFCLPQCLEDLSIEGSIERCTHTLGGAVQGSKRRKFKSMPHQLLNRHIDQVGDFIFGLRRCPHRLDNEVSRHGTKRLDIQVGADE